MFVQASLPVAVNLAARFWFKSGQVELAVGDRTIKYEGAIAALSGDNARLAHLKKTPWKRAKSGTDIGA
ncbi:MAG: hypothetical protein ACI9W2_003193, partial [Gammaproteobacteria bacterium]